MRMGDFLNMMLGQQNGGQEQMGMPMTPQASQSPMQGTSQLGGANGSPLGMGAVPSYPDQGQQPNSILSTLANSKAGR